MLLAQALVVTLLEVEVEVHTIAAKVTMQEQVALAAVEMVVPDLFQVPLQELQILAAAAAETQLVTQKMVAQALLLFVIQYKHNDIISYNQLGDM